MKEDYLPVVFLPVGYQFRHVSSSNSKVCTVNNYNNHFLLLQCGHAWHQRCSQNTDDDGAHYFVELLQKQLGGSEGHAPLEKLCMM